MRVTNSMLTGNFLYNLNQIQSMLAAAQEQMATGKALNKPSDNPLAVAQDMATITSINQAQSYHSTIQTGLTWMSTTNSVLQNVTSSLQSIRDVVLQALNTPDQTANAQAAFQQHLLQMINGVYQMMDTKQGDSYIFGGYATNQPVSPYVSTSQLTTNLTGSSPTAPVIATGGSFTIVGTQGAAQIPVASGATLQTVEQAINAETGQTGVKASLTGTTSSTLVLSSTQAGTSFTLNGGNVTLAGGGSLAISSAQVATEPTGAQESINYRVSASVTEKVNVTGVELFNQIPTGNNATQDLQNTLQSILNDIGNASALKADLANLDANVNHIISVTTDLGARQSQLTTMQTQTENFISIMQNQQASLENANMAQVYTDYQNALTTYQAALKMGSQLLLPTLAQYVS